MGLTEKEIEILKLRKKGLKQTDIAKRLKISQPAVSSFENNAVRKIRGANKILMVVKEIGILIKNEEE